MQLARRQAHIRAATRRSPVGLQESARSTSFPYLTVARCLHLLLQLGVKPPNQKKPPPAPQKRLQKKSACVSSSRRLAVMPPAPEASCPRRSYRLTMECSGMNAATWKTAGTNKAIDCSVGQASVNFHCSAPIVLHASILFKAISNQAIWWSCGLNTLYCEMLRRFRHALLRWPQP